jgi:hypothetical protein
MFSAIEVPELVLASYEHPIDLPPQCLRLTERKTLITVKDKRRRNLPESGFRTRQKCGFFVPVIRLTPASYGRESCRIRDLKGE